jgi:hypothetical protein
MDETGLPIYCTTKKNRFSKVRICREVVKMNSAERGENVNSFWLSIYWCVYSTCGHFQRGTNSRNLLGQLCK